MKYIYILIDQSGSMRPDQIGVFNDVMRQLMNDLSEAYEKQELYINITTFSDDVKSLYEENFTHQGKLIWIDLDKSSFRGATNLGKVYEHVSLELSINGTKNTAIVLLTDGQPTDNFMQSFAKIKNLKYIKRFLFVTGEKSKAIIEAHIDFKQENRFSDPVMLLEKIKGFIYA